MLNYCTFSFQIELLSDCHIGDGNSKPLKDLCRDEPRKTAYQQFIKSAKSDKSPDVALITRGKQEVPLIEVTGLRGALRVLLTENGLPDDLKHLFGADFADTSQTDPDDAGALWLYGGLANGNIPDNCGQLPFWDKSKSSYILAGVAHDRDLAAVEKGKLYSTEYIPAGMVFDYSGVFRGSASECEDALGALFMHMHGEDGFKLGAGKGYEYGLAKLKDDTITVQYHHYCVSKCKFDEPTSFSISCKTDSSSHIFKKLKVTCPGPFFIQDPIRNRTEENLDWQALHRDENRPVLTGKSFLQNLRALSGWMEALESLEPEFDYGNPTADDPYFHLKNPQDMKNLTKTQRLFGVPGWGKTLSVHRVVMKDFARKYYRGQSIQLDTFTQGTIDGSMVEFNVPCGVGAEIWLKIASHRYEDKSLLEGDVAFLENVIDQIMGKDTVMLGHSIAAGFGWFEISEASA